MDAVCVSPRKARPLIIPQLTASKSSLLGIRGPLKLVVDIDVFNELPV